jgi:hypothetical protein
VLLTLFTFSITPRQLLHDVLADHTDVSGKIASSHGPVLLKKGFTCERLNLVAESPFTSAEKFTATIQQPAATEFIPASLPHYYFRSVSLPSLRGPPCI